jgi:hypothetical protein
MALDLVLCFSLCQKHSTVFLQRFAVQKCLFAKQNVEQGKPEQ